MSTTASPFARAFAAAAILGALAFASPSFAQTGTGNNTMTSPEMNMQNSQTGSTSHMMGKKAPTPEEMAAKVDERIKTLHAKLKITPDQEAQWNDVAQAMRDNESTISQLIQERHENATNMTAVDDLDSYQKIAQAHADGIQKVASAFGTLYDSMSDDQKKVADQAFGQFEGHRGVSKASAHKKSSGAAEPSTSTDE